MWTFQNISWRLWNEVLNDSTGDCFQLSESPLRDKGKHVFISHCAWIVHSWTLGDLQVLDRPIGAAGSVRAHFLHLWLHCARNRYCTLCLMLMHHMNINCTHMWCSYICIVHEKKSHAEQTCCRWVQKHSPSECIFLPNHRIAVNWVPNVLPFSILTATVLHVDSLSIPKAEASTTLPKAPCPRVLPDRGKQYLVNGTAAELPVPQVHSQTVSYVLAAALKQHAQVLIIIRLCSLRECVFDCSREDGADSKLFNERLTFIFT